VRLIDAKGLKEKYGIDYSDTHLDRMIKAGRFPKHVQFIKGRSKKLWNEDEIAALAAALLAQRDEVA
jgi:predicted DNA-binding transcriptional regulator AlpA